MGSFVRWMFLAVMQPKPAFLPEGRRGGPKTRGQVPGDGANGCPDCGTAQVTSMTEPVS